MGVLNLPKLGVGAELIAGLNIGSLWPIELGLTYWFDNQAELTPLETDLMVNPYFIWPEPEAGSRLRVSGGSLAAATCPVDRKMSGDRLAFCGGVKGGLLRLKPEGFIAAQTKSHATLELELFARYRFLFGGGVGITYSAGVFVSLLRDRFGYINRYGAFHEAFQEGTIGARLDLAFTYDL